MVFDKRIAGRRVVVQCHQSLRSQAEWLLNLLTAIVEERGEVVFRHGYKIQVGWSLLTVGKTATDSFLLLEPDFNRDPFHYLREDLSCTLRVQAEQNDFSLNLGIDPFVTTFQDKIVYSKACLYERRVYVERSAPMEGDSGWFIGENSLERKEYEQHELSACYVFELLSHRPEVLKVLQLPPGYLTVFDGTEIEAVLTPENELIFGSDQ